MITEEFLKKLCPTSKADIVSGVVKHLNEYLAKYEVNTPLRVAHFIAQAAHESAHFQTLEEYASGKAYEGRKDLGNVNPGDGVRYKGRGIFQLTGRANYKTFGGVFLENNPELAATPRISVLTALEYWKKHNLNPLADKDDLLSISKKINGFNPKTGLPNGWTDRQKYLASAKKLLGIK
jgi:putative chitinase